MAAPTNTQEKATTPAKAEERRLRLRDPFDFFDDLREDGTPLGAAAAYARCCVVWGVCQRACGPPEWTSSRRMAT